MKSKQSIKTYKKVLKQNVKKALLQEKACFYFKRLTEEVRLGWAAGRL